MDRPHGGSSMLAGVLGAETEQEALLAVLNALRDALAADHVSLWNADPRRVSRIPGLTAAAGDPSPAAAVAAAACPVRSPAAPSDEADWDSLRRAASAAGLRSPCVVPVRSGPMTAGALLLAGGSVSVGAGVPPSIVEAERYLARALRVDWLVARDGIMEGILARLRGIHPEIGRVRSVAEAAAILVRRLPEVFQAERCLLALFESDGAILRGLAAFDARREGTPDGAPLPTLAASDAPFLASAARTACHVLCPDEAADDPGIRRLLGEVHGEVGILPLFGESGPLGFVLMEWAGTSILADLEAGRALSLGQRIGILLEGGRIREANELSLRNLDVLLRLSAEVSSTLDPKDVPALVARRARDLCEADEAILFLMEPDGETMRPTIVLGAYEAEVMQLRPKIGQGITGMVARNRRAEIVNHAELDSRSAHVPGTPVEPEAILAVPLVSADQLIGVLSLYKLRGRTFHAEDLDVVNIFSTQAAVAIENSRLFGRVQEERTRLGTMVQHMQEGVIFGDRAGHVLLMNAAAHRMLGLPETRGEESPVLDLLGDAAFGPVRDALGEVRTGRLPNVTVQTERSGRTWLVSVSSVPGESADAPWGEVLLFQDLTDYKRIEAQLLESSKMSAIGQLAGGVAHEFNNLIAGIYGYAQLLKMNPEPRMIERGVDVILKSSERAQELTNSLLTFSRRRAGRREPLSPTRIVQSTLLLMGRDLEKCRIKVDCRLPDLPPMQVDPGELQQVFVNVLINARQAMPNGGEVRIVGCVDDDASEIVIEDTGPGFDPDHLEHVFEPFFTTKGALAGNATPGSGLGLTTAYNIVRDHGGTIRAENATGGGARIVVRLPAGAARSPRAEGPPPAEDGPANARILVLVQSEDEARGRLVQVLAGLGYDVLVEPERVDLRALHADGWLDLAILEGLPVAGSRSTFDEIRELDDRLPVLFVTARDDDTDYPGLADPWAFLLRIPFRDRDLASLTARVLARRLATAS